MSVKNDEYIIGEFKLETKVGNVKGVTYDLKNRLNSYLEKAHMGNCTQLKVQGKSVVVYGKPTIDALRGFEEQNNSSSKSKIQIKFIPHIPEGVEDSSSLAELEQIREKYEGLQKSCIAIERKNARTKETAQGLRSRLKAAELRLGKVETEKDKAETLYLESLEVIELLRKQSAQEPVDVEPGDLEKALQDSDEAYFSRQEDLIARTFDKVLNEIEDRTLYKEVKELEQARKIVENKNLYLKEYGEETLKHLPEEARRLTEEEWKKAEDTIAKYERYKKGVESLEIPVRIAKTDKGIVVAIPVNPKSTNEVSKKLYEILLTYGASIQSEFGLEVSQIEEPFATLMLEDNVDYKSVEERLIKEFGEITDITGIKINPFRTNYFLGAAKKEALEEEALLQKTLAETSNKELEELYLQMSGSEIAEIFGVHYATIYRELNRRGIPTKRERGAKLISERSERLGKFIKPRIEELGYKSQYSFARNNLIDPSLISRYISGEYKPGPKSQKKLAEALKVPLSEIKKRI